MTNQQLQDALEVMTVDFHDSQVSCCMELRIKGPSIHSLKNEDILVLARAGFRYNEKEDVWEARP